MTLPTSRDLTLAPGTQIPSSLLNALQDAIIGARHGVIRKLVPACAANAYALGTAPVFVSSTGGYWELEPGVAAIYPVILPVGATLTLWSAWARVTTGGDEFNVELHEQPGNSLTSALVGSTWTSGSSATTFYERGESGLNYAIVADTCYWIRVLADAGNSGNIQSVMAKYEYSL